MTLEEELAGHTAALLILGLIGLLVVAVNAFALIFVLPSLHVWLWLPQLRDRATWIRATLLVAGFLGWMAVAGQLAALTAGRYAPYPSLEERPPRGPVRRLLRVLVLGTRQRRAPATERHALEG